MPQRYARTTQPTPQGPPTSTLPPAEAIFVAPHHHQVAAILAMDVPINLLRCSSQPWKGGVLSLSGVVKRLKQFLPARFEDLDRDFAVGVVSSEGKHMLIDKGPLAEAVAASAAIPLVFQGVELPGMASSLPVLCCPPRLPHPNNSSQTADIHVLLLAGLAN